MQQRYDPGRCRQDQSEPHDGRRGCRGGYRRHRNDAAGVECVPIGCGSTDARRAQRNASRTRAGAHADNQRADEHARDVPRAESSSADLLVDGVAASFHEPGALVLATPVAYAVLLAEATAGRVGQGCRPSPSAAR
jgi:hypothetical protein